MRSRFVWVGLLVVVCAVAAGTTAADPASPYQIATDQPEPDNTVTRIDLQPDGDAVWTIRFRTQLSTETAVGEYETFQDTFRNDTDRYLGPFEDRMTAVVAGADAQHDREMRATGFRAETSIQELPRRWGVVSFQFRWEGFAAPTGDRLVVGDVFTGGLFIAEGDVLEITAPEGYTVGSAEPTPDETGDGTVQWSGREDFADGRPRVVAAPASVVPGGPLGVGVVALVVAVSVGLLVVRRRRSSDEPAGVEPTTDTKPTDDTPDDPTGEPSDDSIGEPPDGAGSPTQREYELVTNESQVIDVLERNGGQMKQADIVEALDWSKSKTSRVLSEMADDGAVEKIRLGRENVIRLPTEE